MEGLSKATSEAEPQSDLPATPTPGSSHDNSLVAQANVSDATANILREAPNTNKVLLPSSTTSPISVSVASSTALTPISMGQAAMGGIGKPLELLEMPNETLERILSYVVGSPFLRETELIVAGEWCNAAVEYGIWTPALRVCKRLNEIGEHLLYKHMYYVCMLGTMPLCPITRYWPVDRTVFMSLPNLRDHPAFQKVRNWTVILKPQRSIIRRQPFTEIPRAFLDFCRALLVRDPTALHKQLSINIIIAASTVPCPEERLLIQFAVSGVFFQISPAEILQPLRMLRKIKPNTITIGETTVPFAGLTHQKLTANLLAGLAGHEELVAELGAVITGSSKVEYPFLMYEQLLKYAQLFERHPPYKNAMALRLLEFLPAELGNEARSRFNNPFRQQSSFDAAECHPVECNLSKAKDAMEADNINEFKARRGHVLGYLEEQYQRITQASANIIQFIKRQKSPQGLFKPPSSSGIIDGNRSNAVNMALSWIKRTNAWEALVLLEEYAQAFIRHVTPGVKVNIRAMKREWDEIYDSMERTTHLKELSKLLDNESLCSSSHPLLDFSSFVSLFRIAFDEIDSQYREIVEARKQLFEFDVLNDPQCDIDLSFGRCTDPVNWDVLEIKSPSTDVPYATLDQLREQEERLEILQQAVVVPLPEDNGDNMKASNERG